MRQLIDSIRGEYVRYKQLAEDAMAQLDEESLAAPGPDDGNSIATICWHMSGNLASRFTDFLSSDGEKPGAGVRRSSMRARSRGLSSWKMDARVDVLFHALLGPQRRRPRSNSDHPAAAAPCG